MRSIERYVLVLICIMTIQIMVHCEERDLTIFGEDRSGNYFTTSKHKYAIPFKSRTTDVAFPDDFVGGPVTLTSNHIVRGIKHYNNVKDPDCKPELEISKGGINQPFATLLIKSKKGCSIDSTVGFITERV